MELEKLEILSFQKNWESLKPKMSVSTGTLYSWKKKEKHDSKESWFKVTYDCLQ
jgi:hypothetical protein